MLRLSSPLVPLLLAAALSLAGCGDGTSAVDPAAPTPAADGPAPAHTTTLLDAARAAGLSSFVMAATQAGLEDLLTGPGPATVFAPSDEAFAALPPATLEALLLPENREALRSLLAYHVLPRAVRSDQIEGDASVETVNGEGLAVSASRGGVSLTDALGSTATVVRADLPADNGVLHVVDAVLMPAAPDDLLLNAQAGGR